MKARTQQMLLHQGSQKHYSQQPTGGNSPNRGTSINRGTADKARCTRTEGWCSALKRNAVLAHATTQMNLESITLSKTANTKGQILHDSTFLRQLCVSRLVTSDSLRPHGLQPARLLCPWQEYWSGLLFPSPGYLPNPGIEPGSPALQADSFTV